MRSFYPWSIARLSSSPHIRHIQIICSRRSLGPPFNWRRVVQTFLRLQSPPQGAPAPTHHSKWHRRTAPRIRPGGKLLFLSYETSEQMIEGRSSILGGIFLLRAVLSTMVATLAPYPESVSRSGMTLRLGRELKEGRKVQGQ
jgi:hypothetical protein